MAYRTGYRRSRSGYGIGYRMPRGRRYSARGAYRGRARPAARAATIVIQAPYGSLPPRVRAGAYRRPMWRRRY